MTEPASPSLHPSLLDGPDLTRPRALAILDEALTGADDGELFVEERVSEVTVFDDGVLRSSSRDVSRGFGLRAVSGEATGLAHASDISEAALSARPPRYARSPPAIRAPMRKNPAAPTAPYGEGDPLAGSPLAARVALLTQADAFARGLDSRVRQVTVSVAGDHQRVEIIRPGGLTFTDVRPLVRFNVTVVTESGERRGTGTYGFGGRDNLDAFTGADRWQAAVREALRHSLVALDADAAPAGEMTVVLSGRAGHPAARSDRSRPRGRLQPQGHVPPSPR